MPKPDTLDATDRDAFRFVKTREVLRRTTLCRTTLWRLEREGKFPKGFHLCGGRGTKVWLEAEVFEWMRSQMQDRNTS